MTQWRGIPSVPPTDATSSIFLQSIKENLENVIILLDPTKYGKAQNTAYLSNTITNLNFSIEGVSARVTNETSARVSADNALAQQIQQLVVSGSSAITTYAQTTAPSPANIGDIWFDTDDNNKVYRYSGSAWVAVDDLRTVANTAAISTEQTVRLNADNALASSITSLTSLVNTNQSTLQANITSEATTRATADSALATRTSTLESTVTSATDGNTALKARIATEETTRATADSALATRTSTLESTVTSATDGNTALKSRIATEETARASGDSTNASAITALTSTVGTKNQTFAQTSAPIATAIGDLWLNTGDSNKTYRWNGTAWVLSDDARIAAVVTQSSTNATAIGDINAQYSVTVSAGKVTGFKLMSSPTTSSFIVNADYFAIENASGRPFEVIGGTVYLQGNMIQAGSIGITKFASGLRPIEIVTSLPSTGNTQGRVVFLNTDNKLYRWDGSGWITSVSSTDISGTITDAQIAGLAASKVTGQLTNAQLAAIDAAKVSGQLTNAQLAAIDAAKVSGQLTNAQLAAIDAAKVTGQLTDTQLAAIAATKITGQLTNAQLAAIDAAKVSGQLTNAQLAAIDATKVTGQLTDSQISAVSVTKVNGSVGGGNLVSNSGFKNITGTIDIDGSMPSGWNVYNNGGIPTTTRIVSGGLFGTNYLRITANANTTNTLGTYSQQGSSVWTPGLTYIVSFWARAGNASAVGKTMYGLYSNMGFTSAIEVTSPTLLQNTWQRYAWRVTPASNTYTTYGEFYISWAMSGTLASGSILEICAPQIEQGELASSYAPRPDEILPLTITATEIAPDAITAPKIAAGSIVTAKIAANAITSNEISAGAITAGKIAADSITSNEIAANAITTSELAANSVTTGKIVSGTITATELAANSVIAGKIASGAITSTEIAANTITAANIVAGTITGTEIAAATITAAKIATDTITANQIAAGAITASEIATNAVTTQKIVAGAVTTAELNALAVTTAKIAAGAITTAKISAGAVTATEIAANTITAGQIAANTITAAQIAASTITSAEIAAGTITAGDIAAGTITATEIAAGTITSAKIAAGTILASNIAANTITAGQIAANSITASQIAANTITGDRLVAGTIAAAQLATTQLLTVSAQIGDGIITNAKIGNLEVDSAKIANLTVGTAKITDNAVTTPVSAFTSAATTVTSTSGYVTVQTATITTTGEPVVIGVSLSAVSNGSLDALFLCGVFRGTTQLLGSTGLITAAPTYNKPIAFNLQDTPAAGTYTYSIQVYRYFSNPAFDVYNRSLTLLGAKK